MGEYAFSDCTSLKTARVPKGCIIGVNSFPDKCTIIKY
ncbi:MAG: hypothetical protein MJZ19_05155 [Paludibacteraceae bacterium]|nr:hypothetical protein [Paludibacteraceae bacterium]